LADTRLTGEQHDPTLTELSLAPTTQQQLHLLLSANKRRQRTRASRFEPADAGRLTAHLPSLHQWRQPLELVGTERAAVKHLAHQSSCAGRNNDLAGSCRHLQLGRQVWALHILKPIACIF